MLPSSNSRNYVIKNGILSNRDTIYKQRKCEITAEQLVDGYSDLHLKDEVRLVLVGRTGVGKSETGNTILGEECFKSSFSPESVTCKCKYVKRKRLNKTFCVVDTSGFFDTKMSNDLIKIEIQKCICITSPGVHAFLFVMEPGRMTKQEIETIKLLEDVFGQQVYKYMIIVFTKRDELERSNTTIETFLKKSSGIIKELLQSCGTRYLAFANGCDESERYAECMFSMIETLKKNNEILYKQPHYINQPFVNIEKIFKEREAPVRQEFKAMLVRVLEQQSSINKLTLSEKIQAMRLSFDNVLMEKETRLQKKKMKHKKKKKELNEKKKEVIEKEKQLAREREELDNRIFEYQNELEHVRENGRNKEATTFGRCVIQ